MATAQWDVYQVSGPGFSDRRYESPDTLSSVDQYLPMLGNPVNPYDGASSVQSARSRSPENHADHIPSRTPPVPSYSHGPRQSVKRRNQSQGKAGQAAPISAPRMKHPVLPTLNQISFICDMTSGTIKTIMRWSIACILIGMFMTTSLWDTVTLPQPGTYIWFLPASVAIAIAIAYMFYRLFHGHKRQYPLQKNRPNLVDLPHHPNLWDSHQTKQFFRQNCSFPKMNEILGSEDFDIDGEELLNPNLVNEKYLEDDMNITNRISRHRLMKVTNLLREKFNTSTNSKGGNVKHIQAHTVFCDQSQQRNYGCNQSFSAPVPVERAEQGTSV